MESLRIEYAARTHKGRRENNEDACCAEPALGLYAVADGMGGYEGGEVASRLVIGTMTEFFRKNSDDGESTWPFGMERDRDFLENLLAVAVKTANREVIARKKGPLAQMGSTVAALAVRGAEVVVAHVGDSRVYRLRDGALAQLTRDHSFYEEMRAARGAEMGPKSEFPYANVITRAVGMPDARPDLLRDALRAGDTYLLCTDGLVEKVDEATIAKVLAEAAPDEACRALVEAAYARGGRDNITAVVVRVTGTEAARAA